MTVAEFIKYCGRAIKDRNLNVVKATEWLEILNMSSGELYPEIGIRATETGTVASLTSEYQVDVSSLSNLEEVKEVFVEDSSGNKFPYDNWVFEKELEIVDLDPESSKSPTRSIANYVNYHIVWMGYLPEYAATGTTLALSRAKIVLLRDLCVRDAIDSILNDHIKLDRYRTLVGRENEYVLLGMIRDLTTRIELKKRKLIDTHICKSF